MTSHAALSDAELVRLAREGERPAFAVLYHRYVARVYDTIRTSAPDGTVARSLTVATFCDAMRHLERLNGERAGEGLLELARRRAAGHTPGHHVPPLTTGAVDAIWRELDRRWPTGDPPRKEPGFTVAVTVGALIATLILGALAATSGRTGTPDATRTFEATVLDEGPGNPVTEPLPALPRPDATTAAPEPTETPSATPAAPSPTPEPTEPSPTPEPTEPSPTPEPDTAPEVTITSPNDGETRVTEGEDEGGAYATFTLDGVATDDRDPAEALSYSWTSSIDGQVLTTPSGTVRLHVPEGQITAQHQLVLTVTDSAGNAGTATVTVVVTRV